MPVQLGVHDLDVVARLQHVRVREAAIGQKCRHGVVAVRQVPHVEDHALPIDLEVADVDRVDERHRSRHGRESRRSPLLGCAGRALRRTSAVAAISVRHAGASPRRQPGRRRPSRRQPGARLLRRPRHGVPGSRRAVASAPGGASSSRSPSPFSTCRTAPSYTDTDRAGGALWDPPGHWKLRFGQILRGSPKMIAAFGLKVPRALRVLSTIERQHPRTPHWYLAVLGTDPIHQGKGIGSAAPRTHPGPLRPRRHRGLSRVVQGEQHRLLPAASIRGHRGDRPPGRPHGVADVARAPPPRRGLTRRPADGDGSAHASAGATASRKARGDSSIG